MATRVGAGAERDFERLYRLHRRDVYRSLLRSVGDADEAEDVTQIAFLDAYRALQRGDEPERPRAWLLTIAQNVARRRYARRAARPREVELVAEALVAPGEEGPSAADIRKALEGLGPRQQQALVLREIGGRSYVEIAGALGLSVPAVETLLFRARRAFREAFGGEEVAGAGRRRLGGLVLWPLQDAVREVLAPLAAWAAGRGAAAKVAGALSAVAVGTGLAVQSLAPAVESVREPRPAAAAVALPVPVPAGRVLPAARAGEKARAAPARHRARPARSQRATAPAPARGPAAPSALELPLAPSAAAPVTSLVEEAVRDVAAASEPIAGSVGVPLPELDVELDLPDTVAVPLP